MRVVVISVVIGTLETVPKKLEKKIGTIGNQRNNRDDQYDSIVKLSQNTEKSPGDLRRLSVTKTPGSKIIVFSHIIL